MPKGARQMLLASEAHFFDESGSHPKERAVPAHAIRASRGLKVVLTSMLVAMGFAWR